MTKVILGEKIIYNQKGKKIGVVRTTVNQDDINNVLGKETEDDYTKKTLSERRKKLQENGYTPENITKIIQEGLL